MSLVQDKLAKDLTEDKEYLKRCLEQNKPHNGLWWAFDEKVLTIAKILNRWEQFNKTTEVIDFFEAPYKYENKMRFIIENM